MKNDDMKYTCITSISNSLCSFLISGYTDVVKGMERLDAELDKKVEEGQLIAVVDDNLIEAKEVVRVTGNTMGCRYGWVKGQPEICRE